MARLGSCGEDPDTYVGRSASLEANANRSILGDAVARHSLFNDFCNQWAAELSGIIVSHLWDCAMCVMQALASSDACVQQLNNLSGYLAAVAEVVARNAGGKPYHQ